MYIPDYFRQKDFDEIRRFIEENPFAFLLFPEGDEVSTTLIPMIHEVEDGKLVIYGHMARNNPQWEKAMDKKVTILFFGPHHYISPRWYEIRKSVPTWNYVSVRMSGTFKIMKRKETEDFLIRLSTFLDLEWRRERREKEAYYQKMVEEIVAFRIESQTLDAVWKLSQNHPLSDRKGVVENLEKAGDDDAVKMAGMMRKMMGK